MAVARPLADLLSPYTAAPDAPVVVRFAGVGDMVLLTVLLEALSQRHGRPVHVLASGDWTPVLLGHDPAVSELRLLWRRRAPYWLTPAQWAVNRWLRAHRGPVYLCGPDVYGQRVIERASIPAQRLVRAWDHWPSDSVHWADWWLQIARLDAAACSAPAPGAEVPARPRLHVPAGWHREAEVWLEAQGLAGHPLVLVQPGHKKTHKRGRVGTVTHYKHWPADRWAGVIRGVLATMPRAAVLLCGSVREAGLAQEIVDAAGPVPAAAQVVNIAARQPTLQRVVALAARAHSMISVDTGPAHVAGAMDCPLVVLYGQAGWGRWKPRALSAEVIALGPREPTPSAKLMDLSPDVVLAAWRGLRPRTTTLSTADLDRTVATVTLPVVGEQDRAPVRRHVPA